MRVTGWRALGAFWLVTLLTLAAGAITLQVQGALPHPPPTAPEPTPAVEHEPPPQSRVAAPDPALLEPSPYPPARLPIVAGSRTPRVAYAAPSPARPDGVPRIALLLSGFGMSERDSRLAIDQLPGPVAFAVSAYAGPIEPLLEAARIAGHELLASIPMEPQGYPQNDEGPQSLLTGKSAEENRSLLLWALSRTPGAVGATAASDGQRGERFAQLAALFDPVMDEIAQRGLLYIDPRPGRALTRPGLVARSVDTVIEDRIGRAELDARLLALERTAREHGVAIGLAGPLRPATIERIAAWSRSLGERGLLLVPPSAVLNE